MTTSNKFTEIPGASQRLSELMNVLYNDFNITDEEVKQVVEGMGNDMNDGLSKKDGHLPMIPSYVTGRPTGQEKGTFLALDLGGTNLRVCQVTLNGDKTYSMVQQKFTITREAKEETLFDWIAQCVETFVDEHKLVPDEGKTHIPCGFTFSFPLVQTGINRGSLVMWNKGFNVPNVVGRDVVTLTQNAFMRRHVSVKVVAVVNDTVGALMSCEYTHPDSQVGIIFGTGTNACYWEDFSKIAKMASETDLADVNEMVVNMEWGAFDNRLNVLPFTPHDNKLNRKSNNHGLQVFEKMISGMYLGEVIRNALLWLVDRRVLFNGHSSDVLNEAYQLDTAYVSAIVGDESKNLDEVKLIVENTLNIGETTETDLIVVKKVCELISNRAKRLSGAAMCAVLLKRPELLDSSITVGIDGSMYQFFPGFEKALMDEAKVILGEDRAKNLKLRLAKDGSGVGAAIVAMIASKE